MSTFSGMALDWSSCVHNRLAFAPDTPVSEIFDSLRDPGDKANYAAIVEHGCPVGIISRAKIGLLLGSKYGNCLFGKKSVREHMTRKILCVYNGTPAQEVLNVALSRPDPLFYHDLILVTDEGNFRGLIGLRALVQIQSALLAAQKKMRVPLPG